MPELELSEPAEEILAALWSAREEGADSLARPALAQGASALAELQEAGLVAEEEGAVCLTPAGEVEAAGVIRRERLAERLLHDVLAVGEDLATEAACRFEHLLRRGIDDRICTLLGHPRVCPHGSPIPPGACCRAGADATGKIVSSLADLEPGQAGVIAYLQAQRRDLLQRLLTMGALPGAPVSLRQRFPSFVFDLGQTQVAVDAETARDIYVRLDRQPRPSPARPHWLAHRLRGFRGRHRGPRG
jgi:DtxR family Mn-dependent transcriptional regulator